jgi:hypothetical protein
MYTAEAMQTTTSKNGTRIAFDRTGTGTALLILEEVDRMGAPRRCSGQPSA